MSILQKALEFCAVGLIIIDNKATIIEINKKIVEMFDYQVDEIINNSIDFIFDSLDIQQNSNIIDFLQQVSSKDVWYDRVIVGKKKCGLEIFVEIRASTFQDNKEKFCVISITDVSKAFRQSKLLERTQEVAKIGSWYVNLKTDECFWSKMTYKIHELNEDENVFVKDGINFYTEEHRPIIKKCVEEGITKKKSWNIELRIVTTTGKEKWVNAIGTPILEGNEVTGLEGTFQDIHEKKNLQIEHDKNFEKLKKIESANNVGHWEWIINPEKIEWSEGLYKIWDMDPNKPPPNFKRHADYIIEKDRELFYTTLEKAIKNKGKFSLTFRININSQIKYLYKEGIPFFNADHDVIGFLGFAQDVTSARLKDIKKEELLTRLSLALEASKVGVWEWDIISDELIWDKQMYDLYGIKKEDFGGAYSAWENGIYPDDKYRCNKEVQDAINGTKRFDTSFRVIWPSGNVRYIKALADVVKDQHGHSTKMIGVNWDITLITEQRKELENSNKRYELMVEGSGVGIWDWLDFNKGTQKWSPKFYSLLGYKNEEIKASSDSFCNMLHPDDKERTLDLVDQHFKKNIPFDINYRLKTKDGIYKWFKGSGQVARDKNGNPVRMVGSIQNIHEKVLAEQELKLANEELAQFAYRTSHDLKSPLLSIRGLANAVSEDIEEKNYEDIVIYAQEIVNQTKTLECFVDDILSLTKADLKTSSVSLLHLDPIIKGIKQRLQFINTQNVLIKSDIEPNISFIASKVRVIQILENLISNSIKYSDIKKNPCYVKVFLKQEQYNYKLIVEDNGLGFPEEFKDKVFNMFQRFHPKVVSGTGLGMYIVKKHVDKMEGEISFESSQKGTTFTIKLPKQEL